MSQRPVLHVSSRFVERGYSLTNEKRDFISPEYLPWKVGCMSGSTFNTTIAHSNIIPAAMKYISRQPSTSPTNPLTTRDASIPVSNPEMTTPTFRPLFSGRENCEAIGTNIWGIMEQMPVMSDAAQMM